MKTLSAIILACLLTVVAAAQRAENNTDEQLKARNAPDLFVSSASAYGPDKKGNTNFTIEVQNTGSKTITGVIWEYNSPDQISSGSNVLKSRYLAKILPGEKKKLPASFPHYSDEFVRKFTLGAVRIMKVEYEDGSAWQRASDDK